MELTRRQIPFFITSGIRFFEQAHIKDVAAHLRLLVNPQDELSFRRLALLLPGIGAKTAARMWQEAQSGKVYADIKVPEKSATAWKQWAETDRQLREMDAAYNPAELIRLIVDAYYADYSRLTYTNFSNRLDDLKQLEQYALGFSETAELLAQLALMSNLEAEAPAYNPSAVRLSTVHQAKGLEFQAVFVIMLCEGLFPSSRSLENQESEEEERRLFYVAVTRAKDELYLLYPLMRATAGQGNVMLQPSRFIEELPRELCNFTQIQQPAYFRPTYGRQPMIEESGEDDPW
jgi:DNA helicase-2/ATP-dependent DNA helicase PcrA